MYFFIYYKSFVVKVSSRSFEKMIYLKDKDVFLSIFEPEYKIIYIIRSDYSLELVPIWNEIGKKYNSDKVLILAVIDFSEYKKQKIDFGVNEVPYLMVFLIIIIQYFPKNDKENPIIFEDEITYDNLIKFIEENYNLPKIKLDDEEL